MNVSQQALLDLLKGQPSNTHALNAVEMAHLYTDSALLVSMMEFVKEEQWLSERDDQSKGVQTLYRDFMAPLFADELLPVLFLKEFIVESGLSTIKQITRDTRAVSQHVLSAMAERPDGEQKTFMVQSLKEMSQHFLNEEMQQEGRAYGSGHKGPRLYRTFDGLDDIFNLDYGRDRDMVRDRETPERLYQGSGVSVQSGYSTILLALHHLNLKSGQKVIDLGSGYGRVGLVCSLLRPDVEFVGFEYVSHRVEISNRAGRMLELGESLSFKAQDLSLDTFKIPTADVYYLYDPFTEETYAHVLKQIVEVSQRQDVWVVTKGNARGWLMDIARDQSWPEPLRLDEGNLCIFSSAA